MKNELQWHLEHSRFSFLVGVYGHCMQVTFISGVVVGVYGVGGGEDDAAPKLWCTNIEKAGRVVGYKSYTSVSVGMCMCVVYSAATPRPTL